MTDGWDDVVDVDEPQTWPMPVMEWVNDRARRLSGHATVGANLGMALVEDEPELLALLRGSKLLVYHATRLLDYEATSVRRDGLRMLTLELVCDRVDQAYVAGHLDARQRHRLRNNSVFALQASDGREGQVCFSLSRTAYDESPHGVHSLLSLWGGEAVYWAHADDADPPSMGTPTIVVARLLVDPSVPVSFFPSLPAIFVARELELPGLYADVIYGGDVPGLDILDLWQPGSREYARHSGLPQA